MQELHDSSWWYGPPWLQHEATSWPHWDIPAVTQNVLESVAAETKDSVLYEVGLLAREGPVENNLTPFGIVHQNYSTLSRLLRVTAFCQRYINILHSRTVAVTPLCPVDMSTAPAGSCMTLPHATKHYPVNNVMNVSQLSAQEINHAKHLWEKSVQQSWYPDVIDAIIKGINDTSYVISLV